MKRLIPIIILLSVGYLSALAQIGGEVHITPNELSFEQKEGFDLLGNTVVVPVIKAVAERLLDTMNI